MPPTGDLACNPGMCPDRDSNQQPFGSQACPQSTEPHQPEQSQVLLLTNIHPLIFFQFTSLFKSPQKLTLVTKLKHEPLCQPLKALSKLLPENASLTLFTSHSILKRAIHLQGSWSSLVCSPCCPWLPYIFIHIAPLPFSFTNHKGNV